MENQDHTAVMTVEEAAEYLRIGRGHAYEMVREGRIPSLRMGKRILISRSALQLLLDRTLEKENPENPPEC